MKINIRIVAKKHVTPAKINTGSYDNIRTPFVIGFESSNNSGSWHFQSSNGSNSLHISSSMANYKASDSDWKHIAIRNSASLCQIFSLNSYSGQP